MHRARINFLVFIAISRNRDRRSHAARVRRRPKFAIRGRTKEEKNVFEPQTSYLFTNFARFPGTISPPQNYPKAIGISPNSGNVSRSGKAGRRRSSWIMHDGGSWILFMSSRRLFRSGGRIRRRPRSRRRPHRRVENSPPAGLGRAVGSRPAPTEMSTLESRSLPHYGPPSSP